MKTANKLIFSFSHGDMVLYNVICDPLTQEVAAVCE